MSAFLSSSWGVALGLAWTMVVFVVLEKLAARRDEAAPPVGHHAPQHHCITLTGAQQDSGK